MIKKLKILVRETATQRLLVAFVILGLIAIGIQIKDKKDSPLAAAEQNDSPDTVIPAGYVLVPIEIQNFDSLSSLVGSFAVVDLFVPGRGFQKTSTRVGRRLKLVRAPLNPNLFAVLVTEAEAAEILRVDGPFVVAVQNPNSNESSRLERKPQTQIRYMKGG